MSPHHSDQMSQRSQVKQCYIIQNTCGQALGLLSSGQEERKAGPFKNCGSMSRWCTWQRRGKSREGKTRGGVEVSRQMSKHSQKKANRLQWMDFLFRGSGAQRPFGRGGYGKRPYFSPFQLSTTAQQVTLSLTHSLSDLLILTFKKQLNSEPRDL